MNGALPSGMRRMIGAEVVSNFGSMMSRLALPWLAVLALQATPWQMAALAVADLLAGALAALALGAAVDRSPKRAAMVAADLARVALLALLALAAMLGRLSMAALLFVAAACGALNVAFELARSAWIAQAASHATLSRANAALATGSAISEAGAFAVTGAIFQWVGGAVALVLDAASYLVSAVLLRRVPEFRPPSAPPGRAAPAEVGTTLRGAIAIAARDRCLRMLALLDLLTALAAGIAGTAYMIFVSRDLAIAPAALGVVFALGGAGSALGAAIAARLGRRIGSGSALAGGLAAAALGAALVPLAGTAAGAAMALVLLAGHQLIGDAGSALYEVHDRTLRQALAPSDARARIDAALRTLGLSATVAGALGGAAFATAYGAGPALALSAAFMGVAGVVALSGARTGALPGMRSSA